MSSSEALSDLPPSPYASWISVNPSLKGDFPSLNGLVYLDTTGSAIASKRQLTDAMQELITTPFGNPHSKSVSSENSRREAEMAREELIGKFLSSSRKDYHVVFTSGATASCKIIGECYPWKLKEGAKEDQDRCFVYSSATHNSCIGIRKFAPSFKTFPSSLLLNDPSDPLPSFAESLPSGSLVCLPAQCNFTGLKYPMENVLKWQRQGFKVLLDAAALLGTSPLSLTEIKPDYLVLSFYKIFGYPTGLGALLIKKSASPAHIPFLLTQNKPYFGGGTVGAVVYDEDWHRSRSGVEESLEDGTTNFQGIASLKHGYAALERAGGMSQISRHTFGLAHLLARRMARMRHWNSQEICVLHGWSQDDLNDESLHRLESIHQRHGGVVTFNLKRADGSWIGHSEFEILSSQHGFQIRTGCFCNPGSCQNYLALSSDSIKRNYDHGHRCWDENDLDPLSSSPTGSIRVSIPYMATLGDIDALCNFLENNYVERVPPKESTQTASPSIPPLPTSSSTSVQRDLQPIARDDIATPPQESNPGELQQESVITSIFVYPIKSCAGFAVKEWTVVDAGLEFDREWVLVDEKGRFVNQKSDSRLGLIKPTLCDADSEESIEAVQSGNSTRIGPSESTLKSAADIQTWSSPVLRLNAPGMPRLDIPLLDMPDQVLTIEVCGDTTHGRLYEDETIHRWFSSFLGRPYPAQFVKLLRIPPSTDRHAKSTMAPLPKGQEGNPNLTSTSLASACSTMCESKPVRFTNESQFSILNQASIDELEDRIERNRIGRSDTSSGDLHNQISADQADVPYTRYHHLHNLRANLVIGGRGAFEEDDWRNLYFSSSGLSLSISGPCNRCRMIAIDPESGISHREPLHTLSTFRRETKTNKIVFGVLAVHNLPSEASAVIKVGMKVKIDLAERDGKEAQEEA